VRVSNRELSNVVVEDHMKTAFCANINRIRIHISLHLGERETVNMAISTQLAQAFQKLMRGFKFNWRARRQLWIWEINDVYIS
jgi:molybdenum cofactor biosynthesis enzyme MoaA